MSPIAAVSLGYTTSPAAMPPVSRDVAPPPPLSTGFDWPTDVVELGTASTKQTVGIDDPRVQALRREIAAESYLSDDKLEAVVDRLHGMLRAEAEEGRLTTG